MENLLGVTLAGGLIVAFAGVVVCSAIKVNRAMYLNRVDTGHIDLNDSSCTKKTFIELLREADRSMIVYDDGDKVDDSIYDDRRVVDSMKKKLQDDPNFLIRCVFNFNEPNLLFRREAQSLGSRVQIRIRNPSDPAILIHYKMIDGGLKAYLSRHNSGETQRRYRIVNCGTVPKKHQKYVSEVILGRFRRHFEEAFAVGKAV